MIKALSEVCGKKTLNPKHKSTKIDDYEATAYKNCVAKFIMAPQHIMGTMSQAQGGFQ
eukprot:CAMPEP_0197007428 /NCGR_PEP_ID=MMETSP1380-20130617/40593_1 /TAXON_ID=5936 /ORGANISM="Euplotes crassus, Strain CT5" /LENGTH=57 /DNA_ID=CAMNT_0042427507 /DNA_START=39 /DNA_END=212 /DNA_ORIENTATION=+